MAWKSNRVLTRAALATIVLIYVAQTIRLAPLLDKRVPVLDSFSTDVGNVKLELDEHDTTPTDLVSPVVGTKDSGDDHNKKRRNGNRGNTHAAEDTQGNDAENSIAKKKSTDDRIAGSNKDRSTAIGDTQSNSVENSNAKRKSTDGRTAGSNKHVEEPDSQAIVYRNFKMSGYSKYKNERFWMDGQGVVIAVAKVADYTESMGDVRRLRGLPGNEFELPDYFVGNFVKFAAIARAEQDYDGDGVADVDVIFNVRFAHARHGFPLSLMYKRTASFPSMKLIEGSGHLLMPGVFWPTDIRLFWQGGVLVAQSNTQKDFRMPVAKGSVAAKFAFPKRRFLYQIHLSRNMSSFEMTCPSCRPKIRSTTKNWAAIEGGDGDYDRINPSSSSSSSSSASSSTAPPAFHYQIVQFEPLRILKCQEVGHEMRCKEHYVEARINDQSFHPAIRGGSNLRHFGKGMYVGFVHVTWDFFYHRAFVVVLSMKPKQNPKLTYICGPLPIENMWTERRAKEEGGRMWRGAHGGIIQVVDPTSFVWATQNRDEVLLAIDGGDHARTMQIYRLRGIRHIVEVMGSRGFVREAGRPDAYNMWAVKYMNFWKGENITAYANRHKLGQVMKKDGRNCLEYAGKADNPRRRLVQRLKEASTMKSSSSSSVDPRPHIVVVTCHSLPWNGSGLSTLHVIDKLSHTTLPNGPAVMHFYTAGQAQKVPGNARGSYTFPGLDEKLKHAAAVQHIFVYETKHCKLAKGIGKAYMQHAFARKTSEARSIALEGTSSSSGSHEIGRGRWMDGRSWHVGSKAPLRSLRSGRPLVIDWSRREVYWTYAKLPDRDIVFYRSTGQPMKETTTIYYSLAQRISLNEEAVCPGYDLRRLEGPGLSDREAREALKSRRHACFLASNSVLKRRHYNMDAIVRHAVFRLLGSALGEPCKGSGFIYPPNPSAVLCPGHHLTASQCMATSKFVLAMENQQERGWFSEKVFLALLARTVPIHFGAPDLGDYINPKRFILCTVSDEKIAQLRKTHVKRLEQISIPGSKTKFPADADVIQFAAELLGSDLAECIQKVKEVNNDDEKYIAMLKEPVFLNGGKIADSWVDATPAARAFENVLKLLESPLYESTNAAQKKG